MAGLHVGGQQLCGDCASLVLGQSPSPFILCSSVSFSIVFFFFLIQVKLVYKHYIPIIYV